MSTFHFILSRSVAQILVGYCGLFKPIASLNPEIAAIVQEFEIIIKVYYHHLLLESDHSLIDLPRFC